MTSSELLPLLLLLQRAEDGLAVSCGDADYPRREQVVVKLRAMIPADVLESYSRRRVGRKKALAPLVNGTCRACNIAVSRASVQLARSEDALATCSNCGAFIYLECEALTDALFSDGGIHILYRWLPERSRMKPQVPRTLVPAVRAAIPEGADSCSFKCELGKGPTIYGIVIDREGVICRVGDRPSRHGARGHRLRALQDRCHNSS